MKVAVWDTYVGRKNGTVMHFDIIVPATLEDRDQIFEMGRAYLKLKNEEGQPLTSEQCQFCHIEEVNPQWLEEIQSKGYYIYEMEGCN